MTILESINNNISEFNQNNSMSFDIDTLRIDFSKQYKLEKLKNIGRWVKLKKNDNILSKLLKSKITKDIITSAYRLEKYDIYYYNKKDTKYRQSTMVIFSLKQYTKEPPPHKIIFEIMSILKNITNIDICYDMKYKPNIANIKKYFVLNRYIEPKTKKPTETYYINKTLNDMIESIVIYDKGFKNNLDYILFRVEARVLIPNYKYLMLPLYELKEIINLLD